MIFWRSPVHYADGYGSNALAMLKALERARVEWRAEAVRYFHPEGVPVEWLRSGKLWVRRGLLPRGQRVFRAAPAPTPSPGDVVFTYATPEQLLTVEDLPPGVIHISYTMFETTKPPARWVDWLNECADLTLVPCAQNVEAFRSAGVRCVGLLPHGIDTTQYYPEPCPRHLFTFGMAGTLTGRKGMDAAIGAFCEAFTPVERMGQVRLVIKTRSGRRPHFGRRPPGGIFVVDGDWPVSRMRRFYNSMDVYVCPTRGEGFGLTPVQAMCCGTPVIATAWGGTADTVDETLGWPLRYSLIGSTGYPPELGDVGLWAEPDVSHLAALMRHCYEHRTEVVEKGRCALDTAPCRWNIDLFPSWLLEALGGGG